MKLSHTNRYDTPTKTQSALNLLQEGRQDFFLQLAFHPGSHIQHSTRKVRMHRQKLLFHIEISTQVPPLLNSNMLHSSCRIDYVIHQSDQCTVQPQHKLVLFQPTKRCTEVHFASFLSGGFITAIVINPPERKLAKRTSVRWRALLLCNLISLINVESKLTNFEKFHPSKKEIPPPRY